MVSGDGDEDSMDDGDDDGSQLPLPCLRQSRFAIVETSSEFQTVTHFLGGLGHFSKSVL